MTENTKYFDSKF